jgi:hypothetical protein
MSWLGPGALYGFDPAQVAITSETITLHCLDEFDLEPDILKVDVQGAESKVIAGGLETIDRSRPALMLEDVAEGDESHRLLQPLGYEVYTFVAGEGFVPGAPARAKNRFLLPPERVPSGGR